MRLTEWLCDLNDMVYITRQHLAIVITFLTLSDPNAIFCLNYTDCLKDLPAITL